MKRGKRKEEGKDEAIEKMDGKGREEKKKREREMKTGEEEERRESGNAESWTTGGAGAV